VIPEDVGGNTNFSMPNEGLVERRFVIEQYVRYDARKKGKTAPEDMDQWDWSSADDLDRHLKAADFKPRVLPGYISWEPIELNQAELAKCAIVNSIFPGLPQVLGKLRNTVDFQEWHPGRKEWFEHLEKGGQYPSEWPLILRPAVKSESPAKWYVEDGSGRALCFYRRLVRSADDASRAFGYLGIRPDPASTFMQTHFKGF
jgi:hypothetical protein